MKSIFFLLFLIFFSEKFFSQENQLTTGFYSVVESDTCINSNDLVKINYSGEEFCINKIPVITSTDFDSVKVIMDTTNYGINYTIEIKLRSSAVKGFMVATSKLVGKRLALVINDKIIASPILRDPIESGQIAIFCDEETFNEVKKSLHIN